MNAQLLETLALAISEMNSATQPESEAFAYRNPGKLREPNGNLRNFSTWAGGLKSLISELSRFESAMSLLQVLRKYGCTTVEREFLCFDYLAQALGFTVTQDFTLGDLSAPQEG
jgi:hypothetical protein